MAAGVKAHRDVLACLAISPDGVSTVTIRPASITATRSHSRSASSMACVTSTTVVPPALTASIRPQATCLAAGSRPVVISSRKTICGSLTSASAMNKRCRCPPDSSEKCAFRFPASPH